MKLTAQEAYFSVMFSSLVHRNKSTSNTSTLQSW